MPPYLDAFLTVLAEVEAVHGPPRLACRKPVTGDGQRRIGAVWFLNGRNNGFAIDERHAVDDDSERGYHYVRKPRITAWSYDGRAGIGEYVIIAEVITEAMIRDAVHEIGLL